MKTFDPLKHLFGLIDQVVWIAHPSHGRFYDQRTWFYNRVKEPIHRWAYRARLTRDKPVTLYNVEDILKLLEP